MTGKRFSRSTHSSYYRNGILKRGQVDFFQSQASCHGHQRPRKSSLCNNMYTSLEYVFLDLLVKFDKVNFAYSPPSQTRFSSIQNNRNTYVWLWRFRKNLARSTLRTLHRHRPGSLPFKTTGILMYDFGGFVKIWRFRKNLAQVNFAYSPPSQTLFHSKQPEYIFMNLEVV